MTRAYWGEVGGTLFEEFMVVRQGDGHARRLLDGLIVIDGERRIALPGEVFDIAGHDVIVVQTKALRLGMYLLGQALFSRELLEALHPRSIRTVALCSKDDVVLRPIAERYGIEVVVRLSA